MTAKPADEQTRWMFDRWTLSGLWRIDRETEFFWAQWCESRLSDGFWSRRRKHSGEDCVFDSFEEARADLCRRLESRLAIAEDMTSEGDGWKPVMDYKYENPPEVPR